VITDAELTEMRDRVWSYQSAHPGTDSEHMVYALRFAKDIKRLIREVHDLRRQVAGPARRSELGFPEGDPTRYGG
jgi:hypothetical protein